MADRVATLQGPPVVGRFYMVPFIHAYWHGELDDWPVMGPMHTDNKHFNFPWRHYHVDPRFLTSRQVRRTRVDQMTMHGRWKHCFAAPLGFSDGTQFPYRNNEQAPKGRPAEKRMRCARPMPETIFNDQAPVKAMQADLGHPAQPIRRADGRLLCPHRKVDLSSFPRDADGIVVCPLHGLRVQCGGDHA